MTTNKLFVYGIFLSSYTRDAYGMTDPEYATVNGYSTFPVIAGGYIVEARPCVGHTLTGLVVDVDPDFWGVLDRLESAYKRIKVRTSDDEEVYMYVAK